MPRVAGIALLALKSWPNFGLLRELPVMLDSLARKQKRLATALFALMAFALLMGPGPGVHLVNPDPSDPDAIRFLFGMPIIWVWAVFWFMVEAACVVTAYRTLWKGDKS